MGRFIPLLSSGQVNPVVWRNTFVQTNSNATPTLNSGTTYYDYYFLAPTGGDTLTGFLLYMVSTNGTVTNIFQADLYVVDANGIATGASLASCTDTPPPGGYHTFSFASSYACTGNVCYVIRIKNIAGVPASNNFRFYSGSDLTGPNPAYLIRVSTDSGATYGVPVQAARFLPIWTGAGSPYWAADGGGIVPSADHLIGSTRLAVKIVPETDFDLEYVTLPLAPQSYGSPTFSYQIEVWDSLGNSIGVSENSYACNVQLGTFFWFASPLSLTAGTTYYVAIAVVGGSGGDGSNYLRPNVSQPSSGSDPMLGWAKWGAISTASGTPSWSSSYLDMPILSLGMSFPVPAGAAGLAYPPIGGGLIVHA